MRDVRSQTDALTTRTPGTHPSRPFEKTYMNNHLHINNDRSASSSSSSGGGGGEI